MTLLVRRPVCKTGRRVRFPVGPQCHPLWRKRRWALAARPPLITAERPVRHRDLRQRERRQAPEVPPGAPLTSRVPMANCCRSPVRRWPSEASPCPTRTSHATSASIEAVAAGGRLSSGIAPSTDWLPMTSTYGASAIYDAARNTCSNCARLMLHARPANGRQTLRAQHGVRPRALTWMGDSGLIDQCRLSTCRARSSRRWATSLTRPAEAPWDAVAVHERGTPVNDGQWIR
jgi:hypothetical protein